MTTSTTKTGAELAVGALEALGVHTVFGIPGVHTLALYDALGASGIRHVLARHEQGIGFMADGFARAAEMVAALGLPAAIVQEGGYNTDVIGGLLARFLKAFQD